MTLKHFFRAAVLALGMACAAPSFAATHPVDNPADVAAVNKIISRVNEIQAMDKANLSSDEKKALKKELKQMKHQADGLSKKVTLSVGAIIIIILLLILLF